MACVSEAHNELTGEEQNTQCILQTDEIKPGRSKSLQIIEVNPGGSSQREQILSLSTD